MQMSEALGGHPSVHLGGPLSLSLFLSFAARDISFDFFFLSFFTLKSRSAICSFLAREWTEKILPGFEPGPRCKTNSLFAGYCDQLQLKWRLHGAI